MRKFKEIVGDYKRVLLAKDAILQLMDAKNYEFSTKLSATDEDFKDSCSKIEDFNDEIVGYLEMLVDTQKGYSILMSNLKKWERENNIWTNSKTQTIASVFETACATQNFLKLEISLNALCATGSDPEIAKAIAQKGFACIKSDTKVADNQIFGSALMIAKVDQAKLESQKSK